MFSLQHVHRATASLPLALKHHAKASLPPTLYTTLQPPFLSPCTPRYSLPPTLYTTLQPPFLSPCTPRYSLPPSHLVHHATASLPPTLYTTLQPPSLPRCTPRYSLPPSHLVHHAKASLAKRPRHFPRALPARHLLLHDLHPLVNLVPRVVVRCAARRDGGADRDERAGRVAIVGLPGERV
eukprot:360917-Chlamydomonas_euryale.AAC.9